MESHSNEKGFIPYHSQLESDKGFTLIETLMYIALYGIIMAGVLVSIYAIFGATARNQTKAMVQEEGSFLVGKIDWALTGAKTINTPAVGSSGDTLSVTKYDTTAGNPIVITIASGVMSITRNGVTLPLSNTNVTITCPPAGCFSHTSGSGDGINPESATTSFTVAANTSEGLPFSQDFFTVKYLRK